MSTPRRRPVETVVIGTGKLARALVPALGAGGWPVARVVARSARGARRMRACAPDVPCVRRATFGDRAVVVLAVPDRSVASVADALGAHHPGFVGVALHCAGSIGPAAVAALGGASGSGVLHPLLSLGDGPAVALSGGRARLEGGRRAIAMARRLAGALGLRPLRTTAAFDDDARGAYHAAAAVASNDLIALLSLAVDRLERAGVARADALDGVVRLARGVVDRVAAVGPETALTGPVARGDVDTVERHLAALGGPGSQGAEIHRLLSTVLVGLSARSPDAPDDATRAELVRVLRGGRSNVPDV